MPASKTFFLYEYVTGGGLFSERGSPPPAGSLLAEGAAMLRAVVDDFLRLPKTNVATLRDTRLIGFDLPGCEVRDVSSAAEEVSAFRALAAGADATLVIAPELSGALLARCQWAEAAGARLISPSAAFVAFASDKHACATRLQAAGIVAPRGVVLEVDEPLPIDFNYPAVFKPNDGAGSTGIQLVHGPHQAIDRNSATRLSRLEEYHSGIAASVAVLSGPAGFVLLPPCRQRLSTDGRFQYLGGEFPVAAGFGLNDMEARAHQLATRAVAALPPTVGYIGLDLLLGETERDDVVIEVNPRLTTSYVALRALAHENLAEAMLQAAAGEACSLSFSPFGLEFDADGAVRMRERASR